MRIYFGEVLCNITELESLCCSLYARLNPFFSIVHTSTTCLFSYFFLSFCIAHCIHSSDANSGGGGDFVAGFLLGGAVFGTLAYIFAPQV